MRLPYIFHRYFLPVAASIVLLIGSPSSQAQPAGALGENFLYRVISGDTLLDLAQRFTDKPANWTTLQTLNSVQDPSRMSIGIELKIPFALIPELPSSAHVSHVAGEVKVDNAPAKLEAKLAEGSIIRTGPNGFIALTLADGSVLSIPATSNMVIERLRVFKGTGLIDTILTMRDGALESSVAPQATGVGRFEIRTPVSITGVRGTRLRVRSSNDGAQSEVLSGRAQLGSSQADGATLRPNQGAAINAQGKLLGVRALLPAPQLEEAVGSGQDRVISFPPVPGAATYLVQVARNEAGNHLLSSRKFDAPPINVSAPGPGTYYALVRAIDADGVQGKDAVQSFLGQSVLNTTDGSPVSSSYGQFVQLTDF